MTARLVAPAPRYRRSFLEALRECFRRGNQPVAGETGIPADRADFEGYIEAITLLGGAVGGYRAGRGSAGSWGDVLGRIAK